MTEHQISKAKEQLLLASENRILLASTILRDCIRWDSVPGMREYGVNRVCYSVDFDDWLHNWLYN